MGGGGFTMDERSVALDRFALELAAVPVPRVCFLPTASGDPREQVTRFYDRFGEWPCEPSILSLFHLARDRIDPVAHLLAQDVIYVGGGSMRNMLAIWREHSIDVAMRDAWASGTVLAGLSAGAMCWFEGGVSKSGGMPEAVTGSACSPGACRCTWTPSLSGCRSTSRPSGEGGCPLGSPRTMAPGSCSAAWRCGSAWRRGRMRGCCG